MPREKVILPLYSGAYKSDSPWLSSFGCLNMYPEPIKGEGGSSLELLGTRGLAFNSAKEGQTMYGSSGELALIGTPGTKLMFSVGNGPHRGSLVHIGNNYIVSGNQLVQLSTTYQQTVVGTLSTYTGAVSMSSNGSQGNQLTITDGTSLYVYNSSTNIFSTITTNVLANPTQTVFMEGYTIVVAANTNQWQISNFYDSSTYPALMTAAAEFDPGNIKAVAKINRQLVLLGEYVTEIWYDSGNDFPFDHVPNGLIEQGILAPFSVVNVGENTLIWLAQNKFGQAQVMLMQGFQATNIAPRTIMSLWRTYIKLSDAIAFVYQEHGHTFYQLTFPSANKTWVYDVSTGMWHERASYDSALVLGRHRASTYSFFNNLHLIGDYNNGNMYQLDMDTYTDNSQPILRTLITYHITDKREQTRHNYLELEGESGVGLLTGQGSAPVIQLEVSDDGGHTYTNARSVAYGIQGAYQRVARWPWLGKTRNRVYRLSMSDPIKWRLMRLILDYSEGLH